MRARFEALIMGCFLAATPAYAQLSASQQDDIGFTALQSRLGLLMPTGAGVSVIQVEAPDGSSNYRLDVTQFTDKTFAFPSGGNTGASSHATTVGQYFYGANSLASGIGKTSTSNQVTVYDANSWIQSGFLRTGTANTPCPPSKPTTLRITAGLAPRVMPRRTPKPCADLITQSREMISSRWWG